MSDPYQPPEEMIKQLLSFMDNSPAVAWLKDDQGRHVYLSQPYLDLIGVPEEDWYGKTDFDFWPADMAARFLQDDQIVLETGMPLKFEDVERVTLPDGAPRTWWIVKFPFVDSRGNRFVGGLGVDITEQKLAAQQRQMLEQQIANIASREKQKIGHELHDGIGQQLTALGIFTSTMLESINRELIHNRDSSELQNIRDLAKRIYNGLIYAERSVRSLSRGLLPMHVDGRELFQSLERLADETRQLGQMRCYAQFQDLDGRADEFLKEVDDRSAAHLYRIAQECVNNSIKHSEANEASILMQASQRMVSLTISDDGIGIPESRFNESRSRGRCEGLGLRIMQHRAKLIGARLLVDTNRIGTSIQCLLSVDQEKF